MRIERGTVVALEFELRDADGQELEDAEASLAYLHGYGGIFPKVEAALQGREAGHELAITLDPEDAFGEYDPELLRIEPRTRFPETLEVGMQFEGVPGDDPDAARIYTVTDIADGKVVVDGNHPYAGERVWFKCRVTEVRKATSDELAHGHPHGDLGVHPH